ncbi:MAG: isoprenylcysteine carboxylmethyltransferase family protein [Chloroflexota bacterium]|nr:isoprenylcysteine carboxylmethyltransferase family protein [Chloroflexota bacterium]
MDLSVKANPRRRLLVRPLPAYRVGDVALFLVWAILGASQLSRVFADVRDGDLLATIHHGIIVAVYAVNATLFLLRGPAKVRGAGVRPRLIAFLGTWMVAPLGVLPLTWRPDWLLATTTIGLIAIYAFAVWALLTLRRNFSIFPEARHLVRHGPYALVRHPLYAVYIGVYVLIALPRIGPAALILAGLGIAGEIMRALNEERVLRGAFPEYEGYAAATPRFWPRLGNLGLGRG